MNAPAAVAGDGAAAPLESSWFNVPTIRCANCIAKLESGLLSTPGVAAARVNFTAKRIRVDHVADLTDEQLAGRMEAIGFPAQRFTGEPTNRYDPETRKLARALAVAGFAAMNVMLLSVSVWSGAGGVTRDMFHWISAAIALPAVIYSGQPFFSSAWSALKHRTTNMDVPISIGVVLTCAMSLYETATHGEHAYFDGALMLLFFLLGGRLLDSVMRARAADGAGALLRERPADAQVLLPDGSSERRAAAELAPNMCVLVAAGERIPADGVIEQGTSGIDSALVTGEAIPQRMTVGDEVLAGTINLDAPIVVKLRRVGDETTIAEIARTIEAASQSKSRYVRIADRASRLYAPAVHSLAFLSACGWLIAGAGWHQSLMIATAVLIITCPCALGLAVPVAQVVAVGALMMKSVLVKDGSALERLAQADCAMFDKTGTLTLGRPTLCGAMPLGAEDRPIALALARASRHPLSRALARQLENEGVTPAALSDIVEVGGAGIEGRIGADRVRLGRPDWIGVADDAATMLVAAYQRGNASPVVLRFDDALRPDARAAIDSLSRLGLPAQIISGDRASAVAPIASALGVEWRAPLSPAEKLSIIQGAGAAGRHVLMVGDGLNDGPALSAAYVSIAPSSASDVGQASADILSLGDSLAPIPVAIDAARRTMRVVRQNFAMAIGYNILAVPLAIAGQVTPLIAALAMSGSSLIVVANALRLRRIAR